MSQKNPKNAGEALAQIHELFGKSVEDSLSRIKEFVETHLDNKAENYNVGMVGPYILVSPVDAKDPRRDAILAIDMRSNTVFIDEYGAFGKEVSARALFEKHKDFIEENDAKVEASQSVTPSDYDEEDDDVKMSSEDDSVQKAIRAFNTAEPKNKTFH